jgi:hypothetical protein
MADSDFVLYLERWHERALEMRAMACSATETQDRKRLLKVARAYERLAARAEERKAIGESTQQT